MTNIRDIYRTEIKDHGPEGRWFGSTAGLHSKMSELQIAPNDQCANGER